ncbi:VOC family protein [Kallotenue papyrolyticum]|uniref:VOC family protein n=1 Tax=Kallotenue papyrolyticum TaxID=1325125 RepID=UPI0004785856|nr:VOC family protein [Kallotenue papyrolyticum]
MTPTPLPSTAIAQVAIVVPDIVAAAQAWAALLGQPVPEIIVTDAWERARTEYRGQPTPARAKLAFFHLGQLDLELIEPIDGPSTWRDQLEQHGPSLHHVAFQIRGMPEQIARGAAQGMPLIQRGEYTGGRYAYLDGTARLGCVIELLENDPSASSSGAEA